MAFKYRVQRVKNARFADEEPVYSISLVRNNNITLERIAKEMNILSSFSPGDVTGLMKNLVIIISEHLSKGHTVTLDGLGTFSASAELKGPVADPDSITGNHIRLKRICFKPSPEFKNRVEREASFIRYVPVKRYESE